MGMLLSVPMVIAGAILIVLAWRRATREHDAGHTQFEGSAVTEHRRFSRRSRS